MANSLAEEIAEIHSGDLIEAEQLLQEIVRAGRTPNAAEKVFFQRLGWDQRKTNDNIRRVNSALTQQRIAGTPADREAAILEAETSAGVLAKEGPKIQARIAKDQALLASLERDASLAVKRVEEQVAACQRAREVAPNHIKEKVQQARNVIEAGAGQDLREAKQRHQELICVLNVGNVYADQKTHIENGLRRLLPAAVVQGVSGRMITLAYSAEWPALKAECEQEFAELNTKLPGIQAEYDQQIAAAELPLNFYSDPANQENI